MIGFQDDYYLSLQYFLMENMDVMKEYHDYDFFVYLFHYLLFYFHLI